MRLLGKHLLLKLKNKNKGNKVLIREIDKLIFDIEGNSWKNDTELRSVRSDADKVHNEGFYFFNLSIHRTMVLIEFDEDEATIIWINSHDEYERVFKNNKITISKWLSSRGYI